MGNGSRRSMHSNNSQLHLAARSTRCVECSGGRAAPWPRWLWILLSICTLLVGCSRTYTAKAPVGKRARYYAVNTAALKCTAAPPPWSSRWRNCGISLPASSDLLVFRCRGGGELQLFFRSRAKVLHPSRINNSVFVSTDKLSVNTER